MSHTFEVEIKTLLGSKENADLLISKLEKYDSDLKLHSEGTQLNHYFIVPESVDLEKALLKLIPENKIVAFEKIIKDGKKLSIRTREIDDKKVILVIKASVGDDSSSNGVVRIELEVEVSATLDELDQTLIFSGFKYQAKWSRIRKEYISGDMHICLDKNAGYGYLAEFEKVITNEKELGNAKKEVLAFMKEVGVEELPQDRLERMFAYYNENWSKYYGTDNTFIIQ